MGPALAMARMKRRRATASTTTDVAMEARLGRHWRNTRLGRIALSARTLALLVGMGSALTLTLIGVGPGGVFHASAADAAGCFYYTVQPGDTLWKIGAAHGSTWMAIARANDIPNPNLIFPNQRFCIPQGWGSQSVAVSSWYPAASPQPVWHPATPQPAVTSGGSVQSMIEQVFGAHAWAALNVARCESGLNAQAYDPISVGGSHAEGVFQILYPSTWNGTPESGASPYNAMANIQAAYSLSNGGTNWSQWTCKP